jgi:hypothetical protein
LLASLAGSNVISIRFIVDAETPACKYFSHLQNVLRQYHL